MRRLLTALLVCLGLVLGGTAALAVLPDEMLKDPALETRARALTTGLRCVVCEGQSVDDSEAGIARDIRILVRERLKAGESEPAIRHFLVARYGNYILLEPPLAPQTLLLWITPALALLLGGVSIALAVRRSSRSRIEPATLAPGEAARLRALMSGED